MKTKATFVDLLKRLDENPEERLQTEIETEKAKPAKLKRKPTPRKAKREVVNLEDVSFFSDEERSAVDQYIDEAMAEAVSEPVGTLDDVDFFDVSVEQLEKERRWEAEHGY